MLREPSNSLLRPTSNYGILRKGKPKAALISWDLKDSGYITDQSEFQGVFAMSKSNANSIKSSWRNQMQKGSSVIKK